MFKKILLISTNIIEKSSVASFFYRFFFRVSVLEPFGTPRVMGTIESLGCNLWSNMHQIDA